MECEKRKAFAREHCGPTTIEMMIEEMDGTPIIPKIKFSSKRYCDTPGCKNLHYARGKCRSCYYKWRYSQGKESKKYIKGKSLTIHFGLIDGGPDIFEVLARIAKHEQRSVTKQAAVFIAAATLAWLEAHDNDRQ